jgi:hypothetical protein
LMHEIWEWSGGTDTGRQTEEKRIKREREINLFQDANMIYENQWEILPYLRSRIPDELSWL